MKLLIGLGNCGKKYARNRHNIGFMAVDKIAEVHGFEGWRDRFQSQVCEGRIEGEKCLLAKPQTYMNNSGHAAQEIVQFFKLDLSDVYVLHDEIDIVPGKIKVKTGGGDAGHNGLRSISAQIGGEYTRVRLGVGRPKTKANVPGYVLKDFGRQDYEWLDELLENIGQHISLLLEGRKSDFIAKAGCAVTEAPVADDQSEGEKRDVSQKQKLSRNAEDKGVSALGAALSDWLKGNKS